MGWRPARKATSLRLYFPSATRLAPLQPDLPACPLTFTPGTPCFGTMTPFAMRRCASGSMPKASSASRSFRWKPPASTWTTRRTASRPRPCGCWCNWPLNPACRSGATRCLPASISTLPRTARRSMSRCARRQAMATRSTAKASCRRSRRCWCACAASPSACAGARGKAPRASALPTSSTSASAAPTSGRAWCAARCRTCLALTATTARACTSCPMSTAPTSPRRWCASTRSARW
ncbi:hypothetical protein D9M68_653350 [compost metagenome]